jgi:hypothetical protein
MQGPIMAQLNNGVYDPTTLMAALAYVNQYQHYLPGMAMPFPPRPLGMPMPPVAPFMPPFPFNTEPHHFVHPPFTQPFLGADASQMIFPFPFESSFSPSATSSRASSLENLNQLKAKEESSSVKSASPSAVAAEKDYDLALIYGDDVDPEESQDQKRAKTEEASSK